MFRTTLIAATLTVSALTAAPSLAAGVGDSLEACYTHVINACNQNSKYPGACTNSGMDACEDLHKAKGQTGLGQIKMIKDTSRPGDYRFELPVPAQTPARPNSSDTKDHNDRGAKPSGPQKGNMDGFRP